MSGPLVFGAGSREPLDTFAIAIGEGSRLCQLWCFGPGDCPGQLSYPRHSMYAIYAYIGVVLGVNVGIYIYT